MWLGEGPPLALCTIYEPIASLLDRLRSHRRRFVPTARFP